MQGGVDHMHYKIACKLKCVSDALINDICCYFNSIYAQTINTIRLNWFDYLKGLQVQIAKMSAFWAASGSDLACLKGYSVSSD